MSATTIGSASEGAITTAAMPWAAMPTATSSWSTARRRCRCRLCHQLGVLVPVHAELGEFLAVAALAVLGIWLRQRGSPASKPVAAPHSHTGTG